MLTNIGAGRAHGAAVGRAAAQFGRNRQLVDSLAHKRSGDVGFELDDEPVHQAPHLGAFQRIVRHQAALARHDAARLVEIFGDRMGAAERNARLGDEDGNGPGRVHRQKLLPAFPGTFFVQLRLNAIFGEQQADEPARRRHGHMVENHLGLARSPKRNGQVIRTQPWRCNGCSGPERLDLGQGRQIGAATGAGQRRRPDGKIGHRGDVGGAGRAAVGQLFR
jgi:hypothetical protein